MHTNTGPQQDLSYPDAWFNEKGCLQVWGGDTLITAYGKWGLFVGKRIGTGCWHLDLFE
jgi:hypothetical protein